MLHARSFEEHFDDLYRVAYRVAFRILGVRSDAQDAAQEALVKACVKWKRIEGNGEAWVATVSAGLAIDEWRRRGRAPRVEAPTTFASVDRVDDRLILVAALRSLSRRQRQVVVLRYLADLSEADTAEALQCSVGAVKQHASRGLASLRRVFDARPELRR